MQMACPYGRKNWIRSTRSEFSFLCIYGRLSVLFLYLLMFEPVDLLLPSCFLRRKTRFDKSQPSKDAILNADVESWDW